MAVTIRHAGPDDVEAITTALTEAFLADPLMAYLFPDDHQPGHARPEGVGALMGADAQLHLGHGHLYVAQGHASGGLAAALWTPPGVHADDEPLGDAIGAHADPDTLAAALEPFMTMGAMRPSEPHFYLAVLGADDASRGQGLGSQLLTRVLEVCDREGWIAHLESTNPRNVSIYERHGFSVTAEVTFGTDVIVRPMTRQPQS